MKNWKRKNLQCYVQSFQKQSNHCFFCYSYHCCNRQQFIFFREKRHAVAAAEQAISSVATNNGNRTKIVLPDGSQVWLNAGSNLDYHNSTFNKELREVSLNGEAYFDVVQNEDKTFYYSY